MSTKHKTHRFKYTVNDVCLSNDGSLFYAADIDGTLHRRSIAKKEKDEFAIHKESIRCVTLYGNHVISGSADKSISCFDAVKSTVSWNSIAHKDCVNCIYRIENTLCKYFFSFERNIFNSRTSITHRYRRRQWCNETMGYESTKINIRESDVM